MCYALSGGCAETIFTILGKICDPQTKVRTAMTHILFKTDMGGIPQEGWQLRLDAKENACRKIEYRDQASTRKYSKRGP